MSQKSHDITMAIDKATLDSGRFKKAHASLVVLRGAEIGRDFRLRRAHMILGRGGGADIRILDDLPSRGHALIELEWDEGRRARRFAPTDPRSTHWAPGHKPPIQRTRPDEG